jgi:hypothetical protein
VLGRGEAAVRARARKLGLRVGNARGWPLLRVARTAGVSEYLLRAYIRRGELPAGKGAKHIHVDLADVLVVKEMDWQHPPAELEAAALQSLRQRLVLLLANRSAGLQVQSQSCSISRSRGGELLYAGNASQFTGLTSDDGRGLCLRC